MIDFTTLDYLTSGNDKQKRVYSVLSENRVLDKLSAFDPILTGTIPINIDMDTSDLDIICCFADAENFKSHLITAFGHEQDFKIFIPKHAGAVAATFTLNGFVIEIFGQAIPTREQAAYLHMLVEHKILSEKGEAFRKQIVELKKQGYKTELAFGKLLGIEGNAYEYLLKLYTLNT
jgi:hypothetical protein